MCIRDSDIGRRLRLTVQEIMMPIKNIAVVKKNDNLRKVVIDMTEKPLGAALVLNSNNLLGIITEGDLRRCLVENGDIDKMIVSDIMSVNPISVNVKAPLRDALLLMEERKSQISVLPVVEDDEKSCVGLLRLHDIYPVSYTHLTLPTKA